MGVVCNECKACLEEATRKPNNNRGSNQNQHGGGNVGGTTRTGGGSSCYTCSAKINQRPETGRDDFRIQINAQHHGDHTCDQQILTVVFNYPVTFISCSNGRIYLRVLRSFTLFSIILLVYFFSFIAFKSLILTSPNISNTC